MSDLPERIVLLPATARRMDKAHSPDPCPPFAEYVRADALAAAEAEVERLRAALEFYASLPREWVIDAAPAGSSTPLHYGSLATLGERARAALALLDAPKGEGEYVDDKEHEAYESGYRDGENAAMDDWENALTNWPLGLCKGLEIYPQRFSQALARILTDKQKRRLEHVLQPAHPHSPAPKTEGE